MGNQDPAFLDTDHGILLGSNAVVPGGLNSRIK